MAINIKDPEADRMVREAATRRNQPITDLIKDAVRALEAEEARVRQERYDRSMEATRRMQEAYAAEPPPGDPHAYSEELNDDILRANGLDDLLENDRRWQAGRALREDPE